MNQTKAHIVALSLLDRALIAVTDDELAALLAGLPEDHVSAVKRISGLRPDDTSPDDISPDDTSPDDSSPTADSEATSEPTSEPTSEVISEVIEAIRAAAHKGRLNGDLQRLGVVLTDACLAECVQQLGDAADMPTEDDLQRVLPELIEAHGVGVVRLMLASTVVGEAPASAIIVGLLKNDEAVKLPPAADKPMAPLLPPKVDDAERLAVKAQRKERKAAEQAAARLRREQALRAKNRL